MKDKDNKKRIELSKMVTEKGISGKNIFLTDE